MHRKEYYDPILKTRPPNKEKNKFFNLENKIKKRPLRPLSRFLSSILLF